MTDSILNNLAPTGKLRVGINLRNFLLFSGLTDAGEPLGVAADIGTEVARRLQVPVSFVLVDGPRQLVEHAGTGSWDIALLAAEPGRAAQISFTSAYAEIEATYLLAAGSRLQSIEQVDRTGVSIATMRGSGFGLWLERHIRQATLIPADSHEAALAVFSTDHLEALAGLRPRLLGYQQQLPGSRLLEGNFTTVQQAIGIAKGNREATAYVQNILDDMKAADFVARSIARHRVNGLSVAP